MFNLSQEAKYFLDLNQDKRIVFTNGCFDIIHRGHVEYLNEAKSLGDILFIGLNSDNSVQRLKGKERPINSEQDRKFVLENLKSVDFVELFDTDTPYDLIEAVVPNVLVKGGDWDTENIVGSDIVTLNGGTVKSLTFCDGFSTSLVIDKIKDLKD